MDRSDVVCVLRTSRPLSHEWIALQALEGHRGGMQAEVVDVSQVQLDKSMEPPFLFDFTSELTALAIDGVRGIRQSVVWPKDEHRCLIGRRLERRGGLCFLPTIFQSFVLCRVVNLE